MYTEKVMELFCKPKFMGEIKDYSGKGKVGNPKCGDVMEVYIKVKKENDVEIIDEIKFRTFGCVAAIASSEALCAYVKGKTVDEALKITKEDIIGYMGGTIPPLKVHCSILASDGLKKAVEDYRKRQAESA